MKVRVAELRDAEGANDVVRRSITDLCQADHRNDRTTLDVWLSNKTPENMRRWIETQYVVVAIEGTNILGVAAMSKSGAALLNYVAPDARLRGVSKALMANLEAEAARLGLRRLALDSTLTARAFYLAVGYVASGPPQPEFGLLIGHPMQKTLGGSGSMPDE